MSLLQSLMRRFENLHADKKEIDEDLKELMQEVDSSGFEKKAFKEAFKRMQQGEQFDLFDDEVTRYIDEIKRGASSQARDAHVSETAIETPDDTLSVTITAGVVASEPAAEQTAEVIDFPAPVDDGTLPVIFRGETIRISADRFAELKAAGALKVHAIGHVEATIDPREDVAA